MNKPTVQTDIEGETIAQKAMFTGHRQLGGSWDEDRPIVEWTKARLLDTVQNFHADYGVDTFYTGMATGTDTWAAEAVLQAREEFGYDIRLVAAVPFEGQESKWPDKAQRRYFGILKQCDDRVLVNEGGYEAWKLFERNDWLISRADVVATVYDGREEGGTHATLRDAVDEDLPIWRIDPSEKECYWL